MRWLVLFVCVATTSCWGYAPEPVPVTPATADRRSYSVKESARRDLECNDVAVVSTLDRRFSNGVALRYVVEGCAKRGLYLEDCSRERCFYLLVSSLPIAPTPPPPPPPPLPAGIPGAR